MSTISPQAAAQLLWLRYNLTEGNHEKKTQVYYRFIFPRLEIILLFAFWENTDLCRVMFCNNTATLLGFKVWIQFETGDTEMGLFTTKTVFFCCCCCFFSAATAAHVSWPVPQPHGDRAGKGFSRNSSIKISRATRVSEQWNASLDRELTNANELRHLDEFLGNQVKKKRTTRS